MFSFLNKIADKFSLHLFNRVNSPSYKTSSVDNVNGDKHVHIYSDKSSANDDRLSEVICAWVVPETHQENHKIISYEFQPALQNKSDEIIKDLWVNFSSSGFNLEVEQTKHTPIIFDGWSNYDALQLIMKEGHRYPPQNFIYPFKVRVLLKKEQIPNHGAWIYISYGAPKVKKVEIKAEINAEQLKSFVLGADHSTESFLKLVGLSR